MARTSSTNPATATTENGNPLKSAPVPEGEKNRYSFIFPLRPGLTRFEVAYQLPYSGSANLDPKSMYPLEHFVVMVPKAMQFTAAADFGRLQVDQLSEPSPTPSCRWHRTPRPARTSPSKFPAKARSKTPGRQRSRPSGRTAESEAPSSPARNPPTAPAADSARPSTLPTLCRNIAGGFSEASPQLLVIGGVYVASRQQSAARALARQTARFVPRRQPCMEDDYAPAEIVGTSRGRTPHLHADGRNKRRTLPARSRAPPRRNLASGIRKSQVRPRSNPGTCLETRSPKSVNVIRSVILSPARSSEAGSTTRGPACDLAQPA